MKVALELQPCCGKRSGIGTYAYELAKRLKNSEDLKFHGNLFNFAGRNDNSESLAGIDMPILESRFFPYGVYRRIWNLIPIPYQRLFPDKADLRVFFNYIVPPNVNGRVITAIHDITYLRFPETMDKRNYKRLKDGMSYSIDRSDHILTVSQFSKIEIVNMLNIPEENISVIPNAPSLPDSAEDFSVCAEKFRITKPYLLYVGTIEPRKNLTRLLKAYAMLQREQGLTYQLVLAGGRGWSADEIYHLAESIPNVVLTGYVSNEEKNTLYKNASVFVFPSIYEGFGIPPLEAMACGCPVVCSNVASLPEIAGEAAETVDPFEVENIAQGIWRVLSNAAYSEELVQKGYRQVKKFSWESSAEKLTEICKKVLEKK